MIDDVGMEQVNRWIALAQIDGWGEEHRMLAVIASRAIGCEITALLPYETKGEPKPESTDPRQVMSAFDRLAGF